MDEIEQQHRAEGETLVDRVSVRQLSLLGAGNPTLKEAFKVFCEVDMPERHFSAVTRRGYRYDLAEWLSHVAVSHVRALSTTSLQRYFSQLEAHGLKESSRKRKVAAMTIFLRFLEEQRVLPEDFSRSLVWPKVEKAEPRPLSPLQYRAILIQAATNPRDLAMFETMLQTGIRLSELTAITLESITLPAYPSVDPITGYGILRLRRKAGREAEIVINYKAARAIQAYLAVRPDAATNALWVNKDGGKLSNRSVEKAFKKYAIKAGIPWAHVESLRTTHIVQHLARKTNKQLVVEQTNLSERQANRYVQFVKEEQIKAMQENAL